MHVHKEEEPQVLDAEIALAIVLKLFALFLIFNAVLGSGYLMTMLFRVAMTFVRSGAFGGTEWMSAANVLIATGMAVGFGVILLLHGNRAAHWLGVRSGATLPTLEPTVRWYRASIAFVGLWILATQMPMVVSQTIWVLGAVFGLTSPYSAATVSISAIVLNVYVPFVGCALIFRSRRIGDWLYRISNPESEPEEVV